MLTRRRILSALAAAPVATAFARAARADEPTIRFGASATESFSESAYVIDGGFLQRAGMNGTVTMFRNSAQIMAGIAGGSLDAGMADSTQIANALARGVGFQFFAGGSVYRTDAPVTVLSVASASPLRSAKELEGKIVGVNGLRTLAEISTRETVRLAGGDPAKVSFVEIGPALAIPALQRGTVAAAIVSEPFMSSAEADAIRTFAKPYDAIAGGKPFYICSWFAKTDWLRADPLAARRLTLAIYDAAAWTNAHPDQSAPILEKYLKIDVRGNPKLTRATFAPSLDPKLMQPVLDIALRYGLIESAVDAKTLIYRT